MRRYRERNVRFARELDLQAAKTKVSLAYRENLEVKDYLKSALVSLNGYIRENPDSVGASKAYARINEALVEIQKIMVALTHAASAIKNA